jgi:hypothetical protein
MDNAGLLFIFSIVGVLGFGALLLFGMIMMREERARKQAKQDANAPPETQTPAPPAPSVASEINSPANAHEVLRVLRDHLTGRLMVEIAGQRYAHASEIRDANIQQGLHTTLQDLQVFAGTVPAPPVETATPPLEAVARPQPEVHTPPVLSELEREPFRVSPVYRSQPGESAPLQVPSMNPFKQMQVLRERAKAPPPPPPKTITEQIDEILQEKLAGSPYLRRGIHVRTGPKGIAVFELDGSAYEAVEAVPDPEVQALIRSAIAEWEKNR